MYGEYSFIQESNEEEIQAEIISYQDERLQYESSAKVCHLGRVYVDEI